MAKMMFTLSFVALVGTSAICLGQTPPIAQDQAIMLQSTDPVLARNKRLVYDFFREIFEGGHFELADRYLTESYIQHNPNVPSGRAGFVNFFARIATPKPIKDEVTAPIVAIVAEGDLVVISFARQYDDPSTPGSKYTSTWFDMFRIENGKIAEHWDGALKR